MAILYPPDAKAKDAPDGPEQYVLDLLRSQLDDSWHVVPNLKIANHPRHLDGESDVVLLHPKGVMVLEVKGGRISRTPRGEWIQNDVKRLTSPIMQASENMYAVRAHLQSCLGYSFPISFCCVFPQSIYGVSSIEVDDGQIIDADAIRSVGLGLSLEMFFGDYRAKHERKMGPVAMLSNAELARMAEALNPTVAGTVSPEVSVSLSKIELSHLESEQTDHLMTLVRNDRVCLEGAAGTGKTVLGLFACFERLKANPGIRGAFICWSEYLANDVRKKVAAAGYGDRLTVLSSIELHKYFWNNVYERKLDFKIHACLSVPDGDGLFCYALGREPVGISNDELARFITQCSDDGLFEGIMIKDVFMCLEEMKYADINLGRRFDFIAVDEAQDFMNHKTSVSLINLLVKGGLLKGRVLWISDMHQSIRGIFDSDCRADVAVFDPELHRYMMVPLPGRNYRNPPAVARAAFAFRGDKQGRTLRQPSLRGAIHFIPCMDARLSYFGDKLIALIESGVSADEILVVSVDGALMPKFKRGFKLAGSLYLGVVPPNLDADINHETERRVIRCSDILDAKGREFPIVFLVDLPPGSTDSDRSLLYVAMTRCTDSLYVAGSPERIALYRDFFGAGGK